MPNYRLDLEYNGAEFSGSQVQNNDQDVRTVQGELDKALNLFFGSDGSMLQGGDIETIFSSRTDAGVHALGQVVNFETAADIPEVQDNPGKIVLAINSQLPEDMSITGIKAVADEFHARYDAKSREYMYKIFVRRQRPVLRLDSLHWVKEPLDFTAMQSHAAKFIGTHDFAPYAKEDIPSLESGGLVVQEKLETICTVTKSLLVQESDICYKYHIKANRFLRHMVRRIVGELIQVGKGIDPNNDTTSYTAPACGLTLVKVNY